MSLLDVFALVVLIVLMAAGLAGWAILGMLPGRIAKNRNHPQAEAINVCGWWGALTLGILTPLAFVWAYTNPRGRDTVAGQQASGADSAKEAPQ